MYKIFLTMNVPFCDLKLQYSKVKADIDRNISNVLEHGKYIMGPEVKELETKLADFCTAKHAIGCGNGTDALTLALMALNIKAGDEVIMPAFTYFATAEACFILGIKPVFVDVNEKTFNLDEALIEGAITSKTKAIMHVSLFGQCCNIDKINKIAKRHNLYTIEDAAQSFGAKYNGKKSCSVADISCTSFFPSKPLGGYGDGGMCFTNNDKLAETLRSLRVHGQGAKYCHERVGMNSRLDSIQAAILLAKFSVFAKEVELRNAVADRYSKLLDDIIETPFVEDFNRSVWAQYTLKHERRNELMVHLKDKGIPTVTYYPKALPEQQVVQDIQGTINLQKELPVSYRLSKEVFSLPFHPYLESDVQEMIVDEIKRFLL